MGKQDKERLIQQHVKGWRILTGYFNQLSTSGGGAYLELDALQVRAGMFLLACYEQGIAPDITDTMEESLEAARIVVEREKAKGVAYTHTTAWIPILGATDPPPPPPIELNIVGKLWDEYVGSLITEAPHLFTRDAIARLTNTTRQGERIKLQQPDAIQAAMAGKKLKGQRAVYGPKGQRSVVGTTDADRGRLHQHLDDYAKRVGVVYAEACEYIADLIGNFYKPRWSKPMSYEDMANNLGWRDYRKVKRVYGDHIRNAPGQAGHKALKQIDLNHVPEELSDKFNEA